MSKFNRWIRSKTGLASIAGLVVVALVVALVGQSLGWWSGTGAAGLPSATFPPPVGGVTCLPTCDEKDAKFLPLNGVDESSFNQNAIIVWIGVPGDYQSFTLEFFDGDSGGRWDDSSTSDSVYNLYADPNRSGTTKKPIITWRGNADGMPDNAWVTKTVETSKAALTRDGYFYYRLEATLETPTRGTNVFKIRSNAYLSTGPSYLLDAPAGLMGMFTLRDIDVVYPNYASQNTLDGSPYTGEWVLSFVVPAYSTYYELWNGDFDRGASPVEPPMDTDDPNTPPEVPSWAASQSTLPEGVQNAGVGIPADDIATIPFRRSPSVYYEIIDPKGQPIWRDDNPSGTEEWEKFSMTTDPAKYPDADITITGQQYLEPGVYKLVLYGLDLHNAVWLKLEICDENNVCGPKDNQTCPRTIGYWKNNARKVLTDNTLANPAQPVKGAQETRETYEFALDNVADMSPLFRAGINVQDPEPIAEANRLTDAEVDLIMQRDQKTYPGGKDQANSMLARALQQNLAAWLNLGSGKIGEDTYITLNWGNGTFAGTVWEALQEAQTIILTNDTANMERAKSIADQINNGLLGENASESVCSDYTTTIPPDKQAPPRDKLPKAPKPDLPKNKDVEIPDPITCGARVNNYTVENPTNNPFYGLKFEFASGTEIKDGLYDEFKLTLSAEAVQAMTSIQLEAKAGQNVGQVTLEGCDFTGFIPCGDPVVDSNKYFAFQFMGATDNGDGTYTLTFMVQNLTSFALSHATIGLPAGFVPSMPSGSYESQVCPIP